MKHTIVIILVFCVTFSSTLRNAAIAEVAPGIEVELNKIEQSDAACSLTFKSSNHLTRNLETMNIEVYLLDKKGVALQSLQFTFNAIAASKARFAKFDLKGRKCDDIGGIFVNEIKSCKLEGDATQTCPTTLQLRNLTSIKFTDGA